MASEKYIPLDEALESEYSRISWCAELPQYVDSSRIGLNIEQLGRLARLGGFNHLTVRGYSGDVTSFTPVMTSINEEGAATMGLGGSISKAEKARTEISDDAPDFLNDVRNAMLYDFYWPNATLSLNIREVDEQAFEKKSLRDSKFWAKSLNSELKHGIRKISREHLVTNRNYAHTSLFIIPAFPPAVMASGDLLLQRYTSLYFDGGIYLFLNGFFNAMFTAGGKQLGLSPRERRFSLTTGLQVDRMICVEALSRTVPLVKALKTNTKAV